MGAQEIVFCAVGAALMGVSIYLYTSDCRGSVSPSMGMDMTFNWIWGPALVLGSLGILPVVGLSMWWAFPVLPIAFALSFPVRKLIALIVCVPYKAEPTGFQKFFRSTQGKKEKGE